MNYEYIIESEYSEFYDRYGPYYKEWDDKTRGMWEGMMSMAFNILERECMGDISLEYDRIVDPIEEAAKTKALKSEWMEELRQSFRTMFMDYYKEHGRESKDWSNKVLDIYTGMVRSAEAAIDTWTIARLLEEVDEALDEEESGAPLISLGQGEYTRNIEEGEV